MPIADQYINVSIDMTMNVELIRHRTQELATCDLAALDRALGTIHEHLPEVYDACGLGDVQAVNTRELSERYRELAVIGPVDDEVWVPKSALINGVEVEGVI